MAFFSDNDKRLTARIAGGILLTLAAFVFLGVPVRADDPPKKKDDKPAATQPVEEKPKEEKPGKEKPKEEKSEAAGEKATKGESSTEEKIEAARKAALESIEKDEKKAGESKTSKKDQSASPNAPSVKPAASAAKGSPRLPAPTHRPLAESQRTPRGDSPRTTNRQKTPPRTPGRTPPRSRSDRKEPTPPAPGDSVPPPVPPVGATGDSGAASSETRSPIANITTTMKFVMTPPDPEAQSYRFDYSDTPWMDVLDDLSRISGLPWGNTPETPINETLTFRSPRDFTFKEYIEQLNELLLQRPLNKYLIRREDNYLAIKRLPDLMREIPVEKMFQTFEEFEAAKLDRFDICRTLFTAPEGWPAFQVIEEFRPLFSDTYGAQVLGDDIELVGLVEEHYRFRDVVKRLTAEPPPKSDTRPMLTIVLKVAKVSDVQTILRQMFDVSGGGAPTPRGRPARGPGIDTKGEQAKQITIIPDILNNRLFIKAPPQVLGEIAEAIQDLDSGLPPEPPVMRIVKLQHVGAAVLVAQLKPLFAAQKGALRGPGRGGGGGYVPPEIEDELNRDIIAAQSGNAVILIGSEKGVASAEQIVKDFDVPDDQVTEIIELQNADAATIAAMVSSLLPPVQRGGQPTQLTAQSSTKLVVSCDKTDLARIKELIAKFDVPTEEEEKTHFVQLESATPSAIAPILQQIITGGAAPRPVAPRQADPRRRGGRQPPPQRRAAPVVTTGPGPKFIPDDATKTLLVYCNDKDWERIDALIKKLDAQAKPLEPVYKTFTLQVANVIDVVDMLNQLFPPQSDIARVITADPYNSTINIFAMPDFIEKVTPFITELDIETEIPTEVIKLEYAQAQEIAPILSQSFSGGGSAMAAPVTRGGKGQQPRPMPRSSQGGSSIRIVAEPLTNSLLVTAPPKKLVEIRELVAEMEAAARPARLIVQVYNRPAEDVVAAVQRMMGAASAMPIRVPGAKGQPVSRAPSRSGGSDSLNMLPDGDRIIIEGRQEEVAKAVQWIEQLDVVEQKPISRKYLVMDAEEDAQKLQALLGLGGRPAKKPGGKPGAAAPVVPSGSISIVPVMYENVLLIRAMPRDFVEIDELLRLILGESENVEGTEPDPPESWWTHQLKYKKAYDIAWTVEDLLNAGGKSTIRIDEGPNERTVLIRGSKPAQRDDIVKLIEMYDVPDITGIVDKDVLVFDGDKMPAERIVEMIKNRYTSPFGRSVEVVDAGLSSGRVQVIDIHEGEEEEEDAEPPPPAASPGTPISAVTPRSLPGPLMRAMEAVAAASLGLYDSQSQPPVATSQPAREPSPAERSQDVEDSQPEPMPAVKETGDAVEIATQPPGVDLSEQLPGSIEIYADPVTGKVFVQVPEDEKDMLDDWVRERIGDKSPTVYRVFPLKYAEVDYAAQLLNNIFNQPTQPAPRQRPQRQQQAQPGAKGQQGKGEQGGKEGRQQQQQPQAPAPTPARIKVVPDTRTRSLFVAAPLSDVPLIVDVLRKIDAKVPPIDQNIKIFYLKNLDATQVVETLRETLGLSSTARRAPAQGRRGQPQQQQQQQQQMLQMQGQQGEGTVVSSENIKLTADSQTNSIMAKAPPDTLALVESLIEKLDGAENIAKPEMRRVPLEHARASEVASIVKEVATATSTSAAGPGGRGPRGRGGSRSGTVSVNADTRTNSVILAGQTQDLDRVEGIVKELDIDDGGRSNIRQFAVKGDPRQIADTLKSLFAGGRGGQADVVITANDATGIIVVKAPTPLMADIEKQILAMDEKVEAETERRPIKLQLADAEAVATQLQDLFGEGTQGRGRGAKGKVVIKGNKSNNTLYVQCPESLFEEIKEVALGMDKQPGGLQVKAFHLKHASAIGVQKQLETLMMQASRTKGLGDVKLDLIGVLPDARTNSLIVSGGPLTFLLIEQVLAEVDVEPAELDKRETKTYTFTNAANVSDVARNIRELFRDEDVRTTGVEPPTVTFNVAGNTLTVKANAPQHEEIVKNIIEPVQKSVGEAMQDYQITLQYARADEVKPVLEEFMGKWRQSRGNKPQDTCTVTADPNSNLLLVNCSPSTKAVFDKQLAMLDTKESTAARDRVVQTYPLKFANIQSVNQAVTQAFQRVGRVAQRDQVSVSLDWNTNSLLVLASEENQKHVAEMISRMDVEQSGAARATRTFTLKYAEPWYIPGIIGQQFRSTSRNPNDQVTASYINGTMSVVISANEQNMAKVAELIEEVDVPSAAQKVTKYFKLKNARADALANMLNQAVQLSEPRPRSGVYSVTYGSEMNTNTLIVSAAAEKFEEIEARIAEFDVEETGRITKAFSLRYAAPWTLANIINQQFRSGSRNPNDQVHASFEDGTQSLIITANERNMESVSALIAEADKMTETKETRFMPLKHARADELARTLNESINARYPRNRQGQVPITVTADIASNNLIVTAKTDLFAEVEQMIAELDVAQEGQLRRVFKMTYADPGAVAGMIQQSFRPFGRNPSPSENVICAQDWTTNSVVVTASAKKMAEIEALINEMDQPGDTLRSHHVLEVANSNVSDVAQCLQQIFDAANRGRRGQTGAAMIRAINGTTKIAVFANAEEMKQIEELIKQIDVEGGRSVHTVSMPELVPAKTVADSINKLFGPQGGRRDGARAEFHEPTNTLLVFATDSEFEKIKAQVIDVLSEQPTVGALKIFKIPLKYAVADEVARTLQDFFDKKSGKSRGRSTRPPWWGGGDTASQLEDQVTIIAEPASNMLICYCTDTTKEIIDDLLVDIDTDEPVGGPKVMEMVVLKYLDAEEMLGILTEYLRVSKRTPEDAGQTFVPWWMERRGAGEEKTVLAGDMRLKAVDSMNAIIIVGKPDGVKEALAKIEELDQPREGGDEPHTINLANANASEMAETLKQTFNDQARIKSRGAAYIPPTIVPVEATNSLIVWAKPSDLGLITKMAEGLDSEMADEPSGVRILQVAAGRDVEWLAGEIEQRINDAEQRKQDQNRNYRPSLVSIGADTVSNALLIAGSKAKFEEAKRLVEELVALGPAGGTSRRVIRLETMSPQRAKELIEQLQQGSQGQSGTSGRGGGGRGRGAGRRGDANWTQDRRYEQVEMQMHPSVRTPARHEPAVWAGGSWAGTLPVALAQVVTSTAIAQTPSTQPAEKPKTFTIGKINKKQPPQTDAAKAGAAKTGSPSGKSPEERILAATQPAGQINWSDDAREAIGKRLSGAPIEVAEAGPDSIIIDANDEDLEIILSILDMLDRAVPSKRIEYVKLKNARAKELAKNLQDVFAKIEKVGDREVTPEDKVDIIADPRTNGLFIAAVEEKMAYALDLIAQIDSTPPDLEKVRTFVFNNRRATEAGEVLKKMVGSYLKQIELPADTIGVEIDPQTNAVFVTGGEHHLKVVEQIFNGLDAEMPDEEELPPGAKRPMQEADVMVVPLRVANADELGKLLNDLLQKAATGDTPMKDFIRRMRILDEQGNPVAQIDLNRPIAVFGDKDSNALIIASTKENCLIMRQIAQVFDREPARAEVRHEVMSLQYADATEVADQLGNLLQESEALTERPGKGDKFGVPDGGAGALVYKAVVKPDPRTNQLLIIGRPESVEVLTGLVTKLDVKGLDVMPFEIVKLEYASATALEQALTDMMEKRAEALPEGTGPNAGKSEKVIIKADPRSESLIVAARPARMEELRGLITKLDVPASALIENIRTISLDKGNANDLADKLKDLWEQRKSQREGGSEGLKLEIPAIVADERSNSLIVAASKADFEAIKAVVDKIEALELNPMANIYIVYLKYNSAKELASAFKALFDKRAEMRSADGKVRPEDEVAIEVDEVTNALLVAASRENYEVLKLKVEELDREIGTMGQIEFFVCNNVHAERVKETIDGLFQEKIYKPGGTGDSQIAQDREKVTISVDARSNILIVSASPENMALIREIYKRMNSVTMPWDVAITRLITIEYGDAVKIAAQVQDYFDELEKIRETDGGGGKSGFGITVFPDERSNRIIVGGTKDGIDSAVEMIAKLDVLPGKPGQITEVYTLQEAPASKVGEMIRNIFQERNQPRQGAPGPSVPNVAVTVEDNNANNSLLINASREDHILIADLIQRLDRPSTLIDMARVFPLEKARAERVKEILEELYQSTGADGGSQSIVVIEDKRTNSVVVSAPPGELENIKELIGRLDQVKVEGYTEIGVYVCENEDAEKMAELLNNIMTGESQSGGTGSEEARDISSMLVSFAAKDRGGEDKFLEAIRENLQITFNVRSNSVIVVAPPNSLKLIESLIRKLDMIQKRAVLVKVFQLINSDAQSMVDLLNEVFAYDTGSEQEREFQKDREIEVEGGLSATGGVPTAASQEGPTRKGTFGRPKTTFVPDERTNSVIAAGWPEDVDTIADIIDQLDSRSIQDRESVVVSLVNMKADEMQSAVDAWIQAEQQRIDQYSENISPQRRMEQEISVVAHEPSNQMIVSVSPRYRSEVLSIIEQLDMPPPQVMIDVMIAEVTLDDRFEMGLEFALQELRFSETAVPGGNGVLQSSHFDVVGGTDLGAAGAGLAGVSFTITGEDFNFLVRALQSDSRLEVIQNPMIMCQDNETANITIGQKVPIPTGSTQTDSGQINTQITYEDVGIILDVEPQINPDGFVYLLVAPKVSAVSDSTVQVSPGVFAPVFSTREAETTVAIKDGETVVIGGLITTTESESESKVPWLGDLPGIGVLFRTTIRSKQKTELLIALTPRIVRTVEDGRRISIEKRDDSGIITDNMKRSSMFKGLRLEPEAEDELVDIEMPPRQTIPTVVPSQQPVETEAPDGEKPKYGPTAPRYGPIVPGSEDVVVKRYGQAPQPVAYGR
ncbi:MAG: secretin N-terminal domain-containing protein [Planctomycetota bacterium]